MKTSNSRITSVHRAVMVLSFSAAMVATPLLVGGEQFSAYAAPQDVVAASENVLNARRQIILESINAHRVTNGLQPVKYSETLSGISQDESEQVVHKESYAATMNYVTDVRGGDWSYAGELRGVVGDTNPANLVESWKKSAIQNNILLKPELKVVGIGVTESDGSLTNTGAPWRLAGVVSGFGYEDDSMPSDARAFVTDNPLAVLPVEPNPVTGTPEPTPAPTSPVPTPAPTPTAPTPTPTTPAPEPAPVTSPFTDVSTRHVFYKEITWVRQQRILDGWSDGTYRPNTSTTREQMAAVAYRLAGFPEFTPPATSPFKGVSTRHVFYKEISWAKANGILNGWNDGTFRPSAKMDRYASAALFYRLAGKPEYTPPVNSKFKDVPPGAPFYKEIHWMNSQGIANGWNDGTFRPYTNTTRDAMAAFLYRFVNN